MRVEPKSLVFKLNRWTTQALEKAVSDAGRAQHSEVTVEHMLMALFEQRDGDVAQICQHTGVDARSVTIELQRRFRRVHRHSGTQPVFSETLFNWIEQAWLTASVNLQALRVRSGDLLQEYLARPERYTANSLDSLAGLSSSKLQAVYPEMIQTEVESANAHSKTRPLPSEGSPRTLTPGQEALARFCVCVTQQATDGLLAPIFGRDEEIRQMIDILSRNQKNNPILVGEPGVGKTALVEGLALAIAASEVPKPLRRTRIYSLDLGLLKAGAGMKGELESRLKSVLAEIKGSAVPAVLFIDEAHAILGGADKGELADLLKPELTRGELTTIAATTWSEFKKYFDKDAALKRRFQVVKVDEPTPESAVLMLRGLRNYYEQAHGVRIRDEAIRAAVQLAHRYIPARRLPDKAIDLLDTSGARVKIALTTPPFELVRAKSRLAAHQRSFDALSLDAQDGPLKKPELLDQAKAGIERAKAEIQRLQTHWARAKEVRASIFHLQDTLREAPDSKKDAIRGEIGRAREVLETLSGEFRTLGPDVDAACVASVVSDWTGIPVGKVQSSAVQQVTRLEDTLAERIRGQQDAIQVVGESMRMAYAGVRDPRTPIAVLLFAGPSGVGKTETVLALADEIYGGESCVTTINMSEFQEKHAASRLVGSPPGYVGYGEGGVLTEAVRQRPYSVVLLDECEKADREVLNLFYQVFDKGTLSDGEGRDVDFSNTVIILTTNLGSEKIVQMHQQEDAPTQAQLVEAIRPELTQHFQAALLGRMTIVPYRPLGPETMADVSRIKLKHIAQRLQAAHDLDVSFHESVYSLIAERCTQDQSGARAIDLNLRASLMPALSTELLGQFADQADISHLNIRLRDSTWEFEFSAKLGLAS